MSNRTSSAVVSCRYDEQHICNSSDDGGRYAYGRQPWAVQENLKLLGDLIALAGGDSHDCLLYTSPSPRD